MDQVKCVEDKMEVSRPYHLKFFKGCFSQTLLAHFLTLCAYYNFKILSGSKTKVLEYQGLTKILIF